MADLTSLFRDDPKDEPEDLARLFRRQDQESGFRSARQRINRYERLFAEAGLDVPPEDESRGFLATAGDILDTDTNFVSGVIASGLGLEGFKDKGFFEAGQEGIKQSLNTGELFRRTETLQGEDLSSKITRGAASFLGDVLISPITYLTLGSSGIGKSVIDKGVAGSTKVLAKAGKKTIKRGGGVTEVQLFKKQTVDQLETLATNKFVKKGEAAIEAQKKAGTISEDTAKFLSGKLGTEAEEEAFKHYAMARAVVEDAKIAGITGPLKKFAADNVDAQFNNIAKRDGLVRDFFGLADDADISDLFRKTGIRGAGVFGGSGLARGIPILGTRQFDIPIVTPVSEQAFDFLGRNLYNMAQKTAATTAALSDVPYLGVVPQAVRKATQLAKSTRNLISRRGELGGKTAESIVLEHEAQRMGAAKAAQDLADVVFKDFDEEELKVMSWTLDKKRAAEAGATPRNPRSVDIDTELFEREAEKLRQQFNAVEPGRGDKMVTAMRFVEKQFADHGQEAVDAGRISDTLEGYLAIVFKDKDGNGPTKEVLEGMMTKFREGDPALSRFLDPRKANSLGDAVAKQRGYTVETNLKDIFAAREMAQIQMRADVSFAERLAHEVAYDEETYIKLQAAAGSHNAKIRNEAVAKLQAKGFTFSSQWFSSPKDLPKKVKQFLPLRDSVGRQLTPDDLNDVLARYKKAQNDGNKFRQGVIADEAEAMGFDITTKSGRDGAIKKAAEDMETFGAVTDLTGGKARGVFQFIRNSKDGTILTPEQYDNLLAASRQTAASKGKIAGQDALFEQSVPSSREAREKLKAMGLHRADPVKTREELVKAQEIFNDTEKHMVRLGRGGEGPFDRSSADFVDGSMFAGMKSKLTKKEQLYYSGILPKSSIRAIESAKDTKSLLEGLRSKAASNDAMASSFANLAVPYLGWLKLHKMMATVVWPSYLIRNVGSAQFQGMQSASILGEQLNFLKLHETYKVAIRGKEGKFIQEGTGRVLPWSQLKEEMRSFNLEVEPRHMLELADGQLAAMRFMGGGGVGKRMKGLGNSYLDFASTLENFGRQHLYIQLRRQGMAPTQAIQTASRTMVDYLRGKTKFEKNVLNNIIFFYSFARGQAANTFTQAITRPGALTSQLHAVNGVREALLNSDTDLAPDIAGEIESLRSKETFNRYLGKNAEGIDELLTGVGLPAEEISRFINIHLPKEFTLGSVAEAAGTTTKRTLQTAAASTNPMVKGFMEYFITNRSLFFDRPLTDKMMRRLPNLEPDLTKLVNVDPNSVPAKVWGELSSGIKELLDGKNNGDGTMTIDPAMMAILNYVVPWTGRAATTASFLAKAGPGADDKIARALTGIKVTEIDPESSRAYRRANELREKLEQELGTSSSKEIRRRIALIQSGERE